jgi:hypothetical protein
MEPHPCGKAEKAHRENSSIIFINVILLKTMGFSVSCAVCTLQRSIFKNQNV